MYKKLISLLFVCTTMVAMDGYMDFEYGMDCAEHDMYETGQILPCPKRDELDPFELKEEYLDPDAMPITIVSKNECQIMKKEEYLDSELDALPITIVSVSDVETYEPGLVADDMLHRPKITGKRKRGGRRCGLNKRQIADICKFTVTCPECNSYKSKCQGTRETFSDCVDILKKHILDQRKKSYSDRSVSRNVSVRTKFYTAD